MATQPQTSDDDAFAEPIACSLGAMDLTAQAERWKQLADRALIERAETDRGLRIYFHPEVGVADELRQLVAVESECCPWAEWRIEASAGQVVLDVRSAGAGITALHGMFTGQRSALGRADQD